MRETGKTCPDSSIVTISPIPEVHLYVQKCFRGFQGSPISEVPLSVLGRWTALRSFMWYNRLFFDFVVKKVA